jgi:hypothetical protein
LQETISKALAMLQQAQADAQADANQKAALSKMIDGAVIDGTVVTKQ